MLPSLGADWYWWLSAVELPVLAALARLALNARTRAETCERRSEAALADFKLEVARHYASIALLKDVEGRLTAHLLRIEAKLDREARP
jgi:hypothetical protein